MDFFVFLLVERCYINTYLSWLSSSNFVEEKLGCQANVPLSKFMVEAQHMISSITPCRCIEFKKLAIWSQGSLKPSHFLHSWGA